MKAATIRLKHLQHIIGISIHAAREGGDYLPYAVPFMIEPFQSTPPVKAATGNAIHRRHTVAISIHAAREGGDQNGFGACVMEEISIHAAREGGDTR